MADLGTIAMISSLVGGVVQAGGDLRAGRAQQQAANYEAAQLDIKAKEEMAAAQLDAQQLRRNKELALSTLQARSAASGFSATDPTTLDLAGEIQEYGTLQEQLALYGGKSRRAGIEAQAEGQRAGGSAAAQGSGYSAFGSILGGVTGMARYRNIGGGYG